MRPPEELICESCWVLPSRPSALYFATPQERNWDYLLLFLLINLIKSCWCSIFFRPVLKEMKSTSLKGVEEAYAKVFVRAR